MPNIALMAAPERPIRRRMSAEARRAQILQAARETFLEAGEGSAVSLRMIAERSGIDEALIYRHFGSKDKLYAEAIADPVKAVVEQFEAQVRSASGAMGVGREWDLTYGFLLGLLSVPREIARATGMLVFGDPGRARVFWEESLGPALTALEALVEHELPNWEHRPIDPAVAVRLTVAATFWYLTEADITGAPFDAEAVARELTDRLIYGMASP